MSDPEIPGTLVILNAKGLFQGKNGNFNNTQRRPESSAACVNTMETDISRPQFFDPSLGSKETKVSDLRKKFEAVDCDIAGEKQGVTSSDFLNPLHKVNQDLAKNNTAKRTVKKKLEEALSNNNAPTTQSSSALKTNKLQTDSTSTKESEAKIEMPTQPPPRALPRLRSETDPMPMDENRLSRMHAFPQENLSEVVQEEISPQQSPETENVSSANNCNPANDGDNYDDDDDDFDTDEWDSDFDDDDDDDDEQQKRDSQSSHGSSCDAEPLEFPDAVSKKLYNIAMEILTTERAYVRRLHLLDQVFYLQINNKCCAKGILPLEVLNDIFSNIQAIHQLHRDFLLPKLEARMKEWGTNNQIGDILKGLAPFLKMYTLYVGNFDKATETLSLWTKKSPTMAGVIDEIQKSKESEHLTLQHHMLEPVQRVPRYQMLLKDYVSKLPEDSSDLKNTSDALEIISESARHANDSMKKTERFKILLEIQERIGEDYPLITASREFVMEGEFRKVAARTTDSHQERTLMLFNDVLLCCHKFPGTNKYKVKVEMDLFGMEVVNVDEELEIENSFRIISKQRVMDFKAPSAEAKESWVNKLQEMVNELTTKRESYRRASKIEVMKDVELGKKAPAWVRDEAVSMCMLCDVMFTKFRRRHHCRACGRVVCGNCSSFKAALEYKNGKLEKVCEVCHKILVKGSSEATVKETEAKGQSVLKIGDETKIWHSGYLNHKMKGDKSWQKRWFVLSSDFVLFRYKAKKDTKAEFNLPLPGHNVDKPSLADDVDRKNVFKVHHKNVKVYLFEAESEESMNRWMELLAHAIKAEEIDQEELENQKTRANSDTLADSVHFQTQANSVQFQ
ncbi:hypothetical protein ACROYT_G034040 [Oculina patagonica]